eukprot:CAMPEP_0118682008 /NCGR_PEP_ID=MMETSP0800-20121206/5254_1 /TAXON_ID=210618 ORGANISM="Striatella unipunctata, Strain CCMP2910" /NCGR_SAMPLE_ID=MMETSP0800 /ASSEMBLY_ACC=CAM_ASM_000638 /LENGTH=295 /DNA_ID=CAMNT_0006578365 /DNA_START=27 /DNA_END=911 /DNA_ORIENTATION=-
MALPMKQSELKQNLLQRRRSSIVGDSIAVMRLQEENTYKVRDGLGKATNKIDANCRAKMAHWAYQIIDFCDFERGTVAVAMNYLDRFMASKIGQEIVLNKKSYQLAAMTALYLAVKIHEPIQIEVELMAEMSRGCYKAEEISQMEEIMLDGLAWRTQGPTALAFVEHFMELMPSSVPSVVVAAIVEQARYQTELAVSDYDLACQNQSEVALAAIMNAIEVLNKESFPRKQRQDFVAKIEHYSAGTLCEKVKAIQEYLDLLYNDNMQNTVKAVIEARVIAFGEEESVNSVGSKQVW